jgi:hypothetical protein
VGRARRETAADRLALALAMQAEGLELMRENLRRRYPDATKREIDELFDAWLMDRPLDAPGRPIPWPRRR